MTRPVLEQLEDQLNLGEEEFSCPPKSPLEEAPREEDPEPGDLPPPAPPVRVPRPDRSRGRPRILSDEPRSATQIFLTASERDSAKKIGGQMSQGIRTALEFYLENHLVSG